MTYPPPLPGAEQPEQPPPWPRPLGGPPEQGGAPYPNLPDAPAAQAPRRLRIGLILAVAGVALLIIAGVGIGAFELGGAGLVKDSGVAMCEQLRDAKVKDVQALLNGSAWNADTYRTIRKQFVDSRYPDLRDTGTRLIDLAWQLFGTADSADSADSLGAALVAGGQIMQDYSALAGACANHGVDVPT